jgi:hypothetical protein
MHDYGLGCYEPTISLAMRTGLPDHRITSECLSHIKVARFIQTNVRRSMLRNQLLPYRPVSPQSWKILEALSSPRWLE